MNRMNNDGIIEWHQPLVSNNHGEKWRLLSRRSKPEPGNFLNADNDFRPNGGKPSCWGSSMRRKLVRAVHLTSFVTMVAPSDWMWGWAWVTMTRDGRKIEWQGEGGVLGINGQAVNCGNDDGDYQTNSSHQSPLRDCWYECAYSHEWDISTQLLWGLQSERKKTVKHLKDLWTSKKSLLSLPLQCQVRRVMTVPGAFDYKLLENRSFGATIIMFRIMSLFHQLVSRVGFA